MTEDKQFRVLCNAELRAAGDGKTISGTAVVYGSPSEGLPFIETFRAGAFTRCLNGGADVRCLADHDSSKVLGRNKAGTLELSDDPRGLHFRCTMPKTSYASDLMESIRRGDVTGCSFSFHCVEDAWPRTDRREVIEAELHEISVVAFPAYPATSVAARSVSLFGADVGLYRGPSASSVAVPEEDLDVLRARLKLAQIL